MSKKAYSTKNEFEQVYLRERVFARALSTFSKEEIDAILSAKHFKKCVHRVANMHYKKGEPIYANHGFHAEDLQSIAAIFGLSFYLYYERGSKTEKDEAYLLMRYMNQKFMQVYDTIKKKFGYNDVITETTVTDLVWQKAEEAEPVWEAHEVKKKAFGRNHRKKCQDELNTNAHKYAESLCYYATSTQVPEKMRRKARAYCEKHGINYSEWAKRKIDLGLTNTRETDIG